MSYKSISRRIFCAISLSAIVISSGALAEDSYPERPIRLLVGFAPGGFTDILARVLAEPLGKTLGQPVVVENQSGAAGTIAATTVAKAAPDGYTLTIGNMIAHAGAPALMKRLPYDPITELAPITLVASQGWSISMSPSIGITSLAELIARAKKEPGKFTYATSGEGSTQHLNAEMFQLATGVELTHIPYRGSSQSLQDVIAGHVDISFDGIGSIQGHLKNKTLVALAFALPERTSLFPEIPTLEELGVENSTTRSWFGMFAPAGTPKPIIEKLYKAVVLSLDSPSVRKVLENSAADPGGETPEEFADFVKAEAARIKKLVDTANISMQ